MKQLKDFLEKHENKKRHKEFYLDDYIENDPTKFCPDCSSISIKTLHTHNCEGIDYACKNCNLTYTLWYLKKGEW